MANLPATITIDPQALASLAGPPIPANIADLLSDVKNVLADVRQRIADADQIAVGGDEAARRLGVSRRTLQDITDLPSFTIGTRRLWRVADLQEFAVRRSKGEGQS